MRNITFISAMNLAMAAHAQDSPAPGRDIKNRFDWVDPPNCLAVNEI